MPIMFRCNPFQPNVQPRIPRPKEEENDATNTEKKINEECETKDTQKMPPEMLTSKLENEISEAEKELKAKLDHFIKILEQLGEQTLGGISNATENTAKVTEGNPHAEGYALLLNEAMPAKGSVSSEEGIKILKDRLGKLQEALKDIDNDIREATFRLIEQQREAEGRTIKEFNGSHINIMRTGINNLN